VITVLGKTAEQKRQAHQIAGLALAKLRTARGNISGKETELAQAIELYIDGLQNVNSDEAVKAYQGLVAWVPELSAMPPAPKISEKNIDSPKVVILQEQTSCFVSEARAAWKTFNEEAKTRNTQQTTFVQYTEQS